jgi:hypothetical protein
VHLFLVVSSLVAKFTPEMARGNLVDMVSKRKMHGYTILVPTFNAQHFDGYSKLYITRKGTLVGQWEVNNYKYRDHIVQGMAGCEIVRRGRHYLILK